MFRRTMLAAGFAALFATGALAAVSADEAKQLGTTLTPVGAEKAGNKDGTIPEYTGGHQAAGGLQGGKRLSPRSVREREAAPRHHRQGHGGARRQADGGHQGAAQALPDDARRRLSDASHGGGAAAGSRQHAEERDRREDRRRRRRARERHGRLSIPDSEDRLRGDLEPPAALQRPGLRQSRGTRTGTSTPPACRRWL